ncbi:MAG: hypothetical protein BJ554DRAFT_2399 [Olpidium bornovanus]|uniref:Uncharacterized protein n=1 Tax=Olpidium bornovanus TaxID=278681 RepID=A0A8H8DGF9_9FUNG|nr:MAG: hypothetical protein BJ554DRAFT_2399 [Olpidium bornovanus]
MAGSDSLFRADAKWQIPIVSVQAPTASSDAPGMYLHDVNDAAPPAERISVDGVKKRLRARLEQIVRSLVQRWRPVSGYCDVQNSEETRTNGRIELHNIRPTSPSSQSPSHMPNRFGDGTPATTKSLAKLRHPIRSAEQMNGLPCLSMPAITGSIK